MSAGAMQRLYPTVELQYGAFSLAQARAAGVPDRQIRSEVARGRMIRLLPGVLAVAGSPRSREQKLVAATLWGGEGCAAAARAAACNWGFDGFRSPPVEVGTIDHKECGRLRFPDGQRVIVHRVDAHLRPEIVVVRNIPTTSCRRTILDLAGRKHPRTEGVLDAGLRRELTTIGDLWLYLEQEWMRGRRGVAILRELLIPRTKGRAPTDSDLELLLLPLLRNEGLPEPVTQYPVQLPTRVIRLDLAYPDALLNIETDSYSWHMDRAAFERDRERDLELKALGWEVLRVTWAMLRFQPERVVALIRQCLEARLGARQG